MPLLRELDPITGTVIRASRRTANRYEHDHPGSLIHIDVKKLGRIPDGGGWRLHGRSERSNHHRGPGYDFIHGAIDDNSRVAYIEIHDDEKGATAAGFLDRAIAFYASLDVTVERVITDNASAYRHSNAFRDVLASHGIAHKFIRPHCPWTNGKIERLNRTLAAEWAYAKPWSSNDERATALTTWLDHYNLDRHHLGIGDIPSTESTTVEVSTARR